MNPMEDDIESKALELAKAGVAQSDIEAWIDVARKERDSLAPKVASQPEPSTSDQLKADVGYLGKTGGEMAARGGAIAAGQAAGLRLPGAMKAIGVPAGGAISAAMTDVALQRMSGKPYSLGQTLEEAAIGTLPGISATPAGMATARSAIQAAPKVLEYFASPQGFRTLGTLMAGKTAKTMTEEGRVPTMGETALVVGGAAIAGKTSVAPPTKGQIEQAKRAVDDAVTNTNVKEWLSKGGKIDPTLSYRDSAVNRGVSTVAGPSSVQREANAENARVVNRLAREEMGFPETQSLAPINFTDLIVKKSQSLRDIESLPTPTAGGSFKDQVNTVRKAREEASNAWKSYTASAAKGKPDTVAREEAKKLTAAATAEETALENMLIKAGEKDLANQWKSDRRTLAKIYGYRDALIEGNISPGIISDQKSIQRRYVDGNFDLIARFHDTMPKVMRDITDVQVVEQNIPQMLQRGAAATAAITGAAQLGAGPLATAGIGMLGAASPEIARKIAMNPFYQRVMAAPRYGAEDPAFASSLARFAGIRAASQ
jgi:hypothetical protein